MAQHAIIRTDKLDEGSILTPERYDPRRYQKNNGKHNVSDFVEIVNKQIKVNNSMDDSRYVVLDTSDAYSGIIRPRKELCENKNIKSAKKLIQKGDVIISRLRPYLRQVALVDENIFHIFEQDYSVVCSTEFFVLRSKNGEDVSFIVPFLLSAPIQEILSFSQEGGHHPRFNQSTLMGISIPDKILKNRKSISKETTRSARDATKADINIRNQISLCSKGLTLSGRAGGITPASLGQGKNKGPCQ